MRILYITTIGITMGFFKDYITELIQKGHIVDIATNERDSAVPQVYRDLGCQIYPIACERSPLHVGNWKAIRQIRELVGQKTYDIVHCHTPVASICARLACREARKRGTKVLYTAHGFHFYTGAPLKNWILYYPVEWVCAHYTDVLITINKEDYRRAQRCMHAKWVEYVPGVGIDSDRFADIQADRTKKRPELGIPEDAVLVLSVGELNENKNHQLVLRALADMQNRFLHYAIAGSGNLNEYLLQLANTLGISNQFHLLGYRTDVAELYQVADMYILPSIREGLNVSVMEAMASGLPCAVSDIRGNVDLIDSCGGTRFDPFSKEACALAMKSLLDEDRAACGAYNEEKVKSFAYKAVAQQMWEIYQREGFHGNQA